MINATAEASLPKDRIAFCQNRQTQPALQRLIRSPANLMPMQNTGGMFGLKTGVCWWHSRLQRRLTYLAHFKPELKKPTGNEVLKLLHKIKRGNKIVIIPGFKNLQEFGKAYPKTIQRSLDDWMAGDSLLRQTWVKGLVGRKHMAADDLKAYLNKMYVEFKESKGIPVQILNFKGITAHSWILVDMFKNKDGDYVLEILDSNKPTSTIRFIPETTTMNPASLYDANDSDYKHPLFGYDEFISKTHFRPEQRKLQRAVANYCSN